MLWPLRLLPEQNIDSRLLHDQGEEVIDLVRKHWVVYWRSLAAVLLGVVLFVYAFFVPIQLGSFFLLAAFLAMVFGTYLAAEAYRDIFVVTTMRVFRASGVFSIKIATMPITRILDITVNEPFVGRILGYGHIVFESAAQAQGLRDIRFVDDPGQRDRIIQGVVQEAGLRQASSYRPRTD